ncbi:hypothetical protein JW968_06860 [Candidatus Woesearchaeota archaeon]|nr:hypothetical protein [Candidatus Woesearchaeota archaeon]
MPNGKEDRKLDFNFDDQIRKLDMERSYQTRKTAIISLSVALIILIALLAFIYWPREMTSGIKDCDSDKTCFILAAQECTPAEYIEDDLGTITMFSIDSDCIMTKKIIKLSAEEPDEIKNLFFDKSLTCQYQLGNFNTDWVDTLTGSLYLCEGPLKEAIYEVMISQYELTLMELQAESA